MVEEEAAVEEDGKKSDLFFVCMYAPTLTLTQTETAASLFVLEGVVVGIKIAAN